MAETNALRLVMQGRPLLGALLRERGLLTPEQLEEALADAEASGDRLGTIVVRRGLVSTRALAEALAEQFGLEFLDVNRLGVDPSAAALLPQGFARKYRALPLAFRGPDSLLVAVADPTDVLSSDDLRLALGASVELGVADAEALEHAIGQAYRQEAELAEAPDEPEIADADEILVGGSGSPPAVALVRSFLSRAIEDRASDVHVVPQPGRVAVRVRIDGVMRESGSYPRALHAAVTTRLKVMSGLDIAERRKPQDGRLAIRFAGVPMDLRVAVLPGVHGEQVVLRIHRRAEDRLGLHDLGLSEAALDALRRSLTQPHGAVIACGPTGSGKTTTLYAALDIVGGAENVVTTIEDPVEIQVPGITQVEVKTRTGLTFARGLRTILRSDPDVILIGEIRDDETAHIAIQAALTGHLVLTSLHTHNAAGSIARLRDMGLPAEVLASSINCIVAQRLARRLCLACREPYDASHEERLELDLPEDEDVVLHRPAGCPECGGTGYRGRVGVYEVLPFDGRIRSLVDAPPERIYEAGVEAGMATLRDDGRRLVLDGVTSTGEINRVVGERLRPSSG
ncbi:MAG TPA: GspE/PulE family protein [Gaiellaceae bacterium]